MDTLKTLTIKNLKLNKKRTIVTIIGIVLSVALICAVAGMFTSLRQTMINEIVANNGDYHVSFTDVPTNDLNVFKNHRDIKSYFILNEVGIAKIPGDNLVIETKPYYRIMTYDKNTFKNYPINLLKGRLPQNTDEIVVQSNMNLKIDDKITLNVGTRTDLEGNRLTQSETLEYYDETDGSQLIKDYENEEKIINAKTIEYTVVGIIEEVPYNLEDYYSPAYTVFTYSDTQLDNTYSNVYVKYKKVKEYVEITREITEYKQNVDSDGAITIYTKYDTSTNDRYLDILGAGFSDSTNKALIAMAAVVISIIMVSSIFVIKNGFSISVVERYKQFGMLSSIGATSKQIRKSVLYEGLVVGLISIPLGILLGVGAVFVLVYLVNLLLNDMLMLNLAFYISWIPVAASVVTGAITIFLSCLIPAIRVSRMPAIEAIRGNNDIKIKSKKLKTPKYISKLFGVGGEIAHKNLKRNKKKYRTTVISLVVSIVIFIALSAFMQLMSRLTGFYLNTVEYDFSVNYNVYNDISNSDYSQSTEKILDQYNKILNYGKVDRYSIERKKDIYTENNSAFNEKANNYLNELTNGHYTTFDNTRHIQVMAVGKNEYKRLVEKIGGEYSKYEKGAILIDTTTLYSKSDKKYKEINLTNYKNGDIAKINDYVYNEKTEKSEISKTYEIPIITRTKETPLSMMTESISQDYPILIISDDYFNELFGNDYYVDSLYLTTEDIDLFTEKLDEFNDSTNENEYFWYENVHEEVKALQSLMLVVSIFLYGFITVITLIGVTNIFNTITTNMALRSKEFAMLKAIGMSTKEFNRMIRLESILYGSKSLIIGLPIGIALSYLIYNSMDAAITLNYKLPFLAIIIAIGFVFLIVFMIMKYSLKKVNKQNIIETIRSENI